VNLSAALPLVGRWLLYGFTLFTLASHLTVLTGGNLYRLVVLASLLTAAAVIAHRLFGLRESVAPDPMSGPATENAPMSGEPPLATISSQNRLTLLVLIAAVALTLCVNQPNLDDSLYVNMSVAAADDPSAPILNRPFLHSIGDPKFFLPNYKLHSLEMLVALVSAVTGIEPIWIFHLAIAPAAAALCILAYGVLFRRLCPGRHGYAVLAAFVFLVAMCDAEHSYGQFAFVRLQQGKGILLSVMVPILIVVGLEFARRPGLREWVDLSAAQIAAVGLTANGLLVGPTVAGLAVLSGLVARRDWRSLRTVAWTVAASAYPVAAGLLVRFKMQFVFSAGLNESRLIGEVTDAGLFLFANAVDVFGTGPLAWFCLILVLYGRSLADHGEARAVNLVFPLALVVLVNPITIGFVARFAVSVELFWRIFWVLPMAVLAGTAIAGPLRWWQGRRGRVALLGYAVILGLVLFWLPQRTAVSAAATTSIGAPGLKVPKEYAVAVAIRDHCPADRNVLAPFSVSPWITTLSHHPYPLVSRQLYAYSLEDERDMRVSLTRLVSGAPETKDMFYSVGRLLRRFDVQCVCFAESEERLDELPGFLSRARFLPLMSIEGYEIWYVDPAPISEAIFAEGFESGIPDQWSGHQPFQPTTGE